MFIFFPTPLYQSQKEMFDHKKVKIETPTLRFYLLNIDIVLVRSSSKHAHNIDIRQLQSNFEPTEFDS